MANRGGAAVVVTRGARPKFPWSWLREWRHPVPPGRDPVWNVVSPDRALPGAAAVRGHCLLTPQLRGFLCLLGRSDWCGRRLTIVQSKAATLTVNEHARTCGRERQRLRESILAAAGGLCQCDECRAKKRARIASEIDHYVPLWEGGTDDPTNLRAISRVCHRRKLAAEARRRFGG